MIRKRHMSFEVSENSLFTLRRGISTSQLPTRGCARVYYLDESTNAICIKSAEFNQLASHPTQTYDAIETDSFQNDVQALGFSPTFKRTFYLAFPDEVKDGFSQ